MKLLKSIFEPDYEERAAIREFDGGQDRFIAEGVAVEDMRERAEQQGQLETLRSRSEVEALIVERDRVKNIWLAETDPQRNKELLSQWQELCMKIIDLKQKGV